MGNVFWADPLVLKEVGEQLERRRGPSALTAADSDRPEAATTSRPQDRLPRRDRRHRPVRVHLQLLHGVNGLIKGLEAVNGDLSDRQALQEALAASRSGDGAVRRHHARRQPQRHHEHLRQADRRKDRRRLRRQDDPQDHGRRPDVRRGVHAGHAGAGPREPEVREARPPPPWVGNAERSTRAAEVGRRWQLPVDIREGAEPILRLRGVGRRFGGVLAVRDVDLDVRPASGAPSSGPNGAGKTTLFNLISGEFPPTAGTVELFGGDVTRLPARKRARTWGSRARSRSPGCSSA